MADVRWLVIYSRREHMRPDSDETMSVLVGTPLYGIRVGGIKFGDEFVGGLIATDERAGEWYHHAATCRVVPGGEVPNA